MSSIKKLPLAGSIGSFFILCSLLLFTSPTNNVRTPGLFFIILLLFLVSSFVVHRHYQRANNRQAVNAYSAAIISVAIVIMGMLQTLRLLHLVDFIIIMAIAVGLIFYFERRF